MKEESVAEEMEEESDVEEMKKIAENYLKALTPAEVRKEGNADEVTDGSISYYYCVNGSAAVKNISGNEVVKIPNKIRCADDKKEYEVKKINAHAIKDTNKLQVVVVDGDIVIARGLVENASADYKVVKFVVGDTVVQTQIVLTGDGKDAKVMVPEDVGQGMNLAFGKTWCFEGTNEQVDFSKQLKTDAKEIRIEAK